MHRRAQGGVVKRKALTGLAALTLFDIAAAHAQAPVANQWTGYYVGGHAGYRWAQVDGSAPYAGLPVYDAFFNPSFPVFTTPLSFNPKNGVVGIHGGYNAQVSARWLTGFEADFSFGRGSATNSIFQIDPVNFTSGTVSFSASVDWSATLRGRVGYTVGPSLFYATGGLAVTQVSISANGSFGGGDSFACGDFFTCIYSTGSTSTFSSKKTLVGGVVGAGIEQLLGRNVMLRVEYLFAYYGNVNFGNAVINSTYFDNYICVCTINSTASGPVSATVSTQTVRLGLSYRLP
jgi:outer membrane immunogenic protein